MDEKDGTRLVQFFPDGIKFRISEIIVSNLTGNPPAVGLTRLLRRFPNELKGFWDVWERQESEATCIQLFVNFHASFHIQSHAMGDVTVSTYRISMDSRQHTQAVS